VSKARKTLRTYGERGRSARVFVERGGTRVRVQWRVHGLLQTKSFPNTPRGKADAKGYAQGVVDSLEARAIPARVTVAELWGLYAKSELPNLRPRTFALNADAWREWELFVGRETVAEDLGVDTMTRFRVALENERKLGVRTVGRHIGGVRLIYNWGEAQELLARNKLHRYRYKIGKDRRPAKVPEYRAEEFEAILAQLPVTGASRHWRAGGVLALCGYQGARQNAVRHLRWDDVVDADRSNTITWRARWDKLGKERVQPLRSPAIQVLIEVRKQHHRLGLDSPWVFPAPRERKRSDDPVYSAQALWWELTQAERRAGVPHKRGRGAHGLRRMLAGDVLAITSNLKTAGDAIGDKDLRILQEHYLSDRPEEVRAAFEALDASNRNATGNGAKGAVAK
jgi:integrase